jgi:A/G-specific adenine glycosylase
MINEPASLYAEPEHLSERSNIKSVGLSHYREWYWAVMDYGTYLKQTVGNVGRASKSYLKQSKFNGSRRQIRGQVIRALVERSRTLQQLQALSADERLNEVLVALTAEGLIRKHGDTYSLS